MGEGTEKLLARDNFKAKRGFTRGIKRYINCSDLLKRTKVDPKDIFIIEKDIVRFHGSQIGIVDACLVKMLNIWRCLMMKTTGFVKGDMVSDLDLPTVKIAIIRMTEGIFEAEEDSLMRMYIKLGRAVTRR